MLIGIVAVVVGAAALLIVWLSLRGRRTAASRSPEVVPFQAARKRTGKRISKRDERSAGEQARPCSLCRERSARLYFYLDESGRTIGTCKACRPKAEARQLDRL